MLYPLIGVILGILAGLFIPYTVSAGSAAYVAIAILAAFDSMMGGCAAVINKNFNLVVFITGFFGNALLSVLMVFLGSKLALDLYIAVGVVFGVRIFQNFTIIRRFLLNKWRKSDKIEKKTD